MARYTDDAVDPLIGMARFRTRRTSWLVAISHRVRMSTVDVRSDLSHSQRPGGKVTAENVNVVIDEADGAGSGAMAVSAFALKFGAN